MRVLELWRYPVKSMQGERRDEVTVAQLGLSGDRTHALLDVATGVLLTARREPALLFATGRRRADGDVEVVLPDGSTAAVDDDLSRWLGRSVRLVAAGSVQSPTYESADAAADEEEAGGWHRWAGPTGAFHDDGNVRVSLVGMGTIHRSGQWDVRRFRPNVVVDGDDEDGLIGRRVRVGGAILDVVQPVRRCVMVTRSQPGGIERDLSVLRTILRDRDAHLAVGALVATPGTMRVGDEVEAMG